jgi:hypothetical protein
MKLPNIEKSNPQMSKNKKNHSLIKQKYKIVNNEESVFKLDTFINKMKEVKELKIYLKENFNKQEIDDVFMKDIELEYAEQFLMKMKVYPTKEMIRKILKLSPLKLCDFELHNEFIYVNEKEKYIKVIHIFPVYGRKEKNFKTININPNKRKSIIINNLNDISKNQNYTTSESNLIFEKLNLKRNPIKNLSRDIKNRTNFNSIETSPGQKVKNIKSFFGTGDHFANRKGINILRRTNFQVNTNRDFLYNKERIDEIFNKDRENVLNVLLFSNQKSSMKVDLSPENIKEKYISSEPNWSTQTMENKGKLSRISKSILTSKNVLNNEKYFFNLVDLDKLTTEIMEEVNEPLNIQVELVIKDLNYILEYFPLEEFVEIKRNENLKMDIRSDFTNRINVNNREDLLKILKIINSLDSCRVIGLCVNLIYWIIFGGNANIQVDSNTKELIYLKLMKEWESIENKFNNKNLFYKVFVPLFIIIMRIEIENIFRRKYINLFKSKKNETEVLKRTNAVISEIFDKHGYMNSFSIFYGKQSEFNKKIKKNYMPRYKNKLFATSNFMDILFRNENDNLRSNSFENIKAKQSFIINHKADYFNYYLNKINSGLVKRNLEPIFKVRTGLSKNVNNEKIKKKESLANDITKINKTDSEENINFIDYIEKTKQDYIKRFANIKKKFPHKNNV